MTVVGPGGVVVETRDALAVAERLGEFDRRQLATELGIKPISVGRIIDALAGNGRLERDGRRFRVVGTSDPDGGFDDGPGGQQTQHEPPPTPRPKLVPEPERAHDLTREARDAARALGRWTAPELAAYLKLSRPKARAVVEQLVNDGIATPTGGRWRNSPVYAYEPPKATVTRRERRHNPEADAARLAGPAPKRSTPVAGTGRGIRSGNTIVNELLREVRGFSHVKVERRSHKYAFVIGGREVASCSTTPGASALGGTRSQLRAAGVPVAA